MLLDLDQYYTPIEVAEHIISSGISCKPSVCVDSTCGSGNLLSAANNAFPNLTCIGLDKDKKNIGKLKRANPNWILSAADLLNPLSYKKSSVILDNKFCDFLLLNPPFSQNNKKYLNIEYRGHSIKGSAAMAYILKSFELFKPSKGALIIVPESVLYSEIDRDARKLLEENYGISVITELENSTFKGARVRATVIKLDPYSNENLRSTFSYPKFTQIDINLIRGSLPVHERDNNKMAQGLRYIHSTDIRKLHQNQINSEFTQVKITSNGVTLGWNILIPRVGIPNRNLLKPLFLKHPVRLSDCVIALKFKNKLDAVECCERLDYLWNDLLNLYRGTGARYVTIDRLQTWLKSARINNI